MSYADAQRTVRSVILRITAMKKGERSLGVPELYNERFHAMFLAFNDKLSEHGAVGRGGRGTWRSSVGLAIP